MKHNYTSCGCCGKAINDKFTNFYKIKHGLCFGPFQPVWGFRIDICQDCWKDIQNYVKEKRNETMA